MTLFRYFYRKKILHGQYSFLKWNYLRYLRDFSNEYQYNLVIVFFFVDKN